MILVTGATGKVGGEVVRRLAARGAPVRALTRDPAKAAHLSALGRVEIAQGDFGQPESLDAALAGVERVFLLPPDETDMADLIVAMVDACRRAGVSRVVKLSALGSVLGGHSILGWHAIGDEALRASGIPCTILYANSFMQNFLLFYADDIAKKDMFKYCTGAAKLAKVDARDVGAVAAAALTEPGHEGKTYDVTGPEPLSYYDMASVLSSVLGRTITYVSLSDDEYTRALSGSGWPAWIIDVLVGLYGAKGYYGDGRAAPVTDTVERLTGAPPRTFEAFVREHAAAFARPA
jgi:uncharacterized protein YbjT (DUF2867 family)